MRIIRLNTAVVGSGAAGFNAAVRLKQFGVEHVAIITEGVNMGTSRNTGSDKQTYYKLGLGGDVQDSVKNMAEDLFSTGCVDGDNALCEAALSVRSFLHLCERGVPFPTNRYGEYIGYKTDHDPYARATSVGPLTSKEMTEALEKEAEERGVEIYDGHLAVSIIKDGNRAVGLLTLDTNTDEFCLFNCKNIVYATGGPAGIYEDSVYPTCHTGSSGVAFEAGARGQNLTEWQYGLASVAPRWNVSGTYMQVLPRFVSVDENGTEREFLAEYFTDENECLSNVFLKGYQWPFDSRKVMDGSSVIDLLVYRERVLRGRRVFLDFRSNPFGHEPNYEKLSDAAREYLQKAGATFGTPIERLLHMNAPAVELYATKGVDITREMLEISLCSQHNNGGIAVDMWWESSVEGLFAVGEVAGTHGIYRPGGSALNAGQVGSLRAAQYISRHGLGEPMDDDKFLSLAEKTVESFERLAENIRKNPDNIDKAALASRRLMSSCAGAIRRPDEIKKALEQTRTALSDFDINVGAKSLADALRLRDTLICQIVYFSAMLDYSSVAKTRGSALYTDKCGDLRDGLDECFRFSSDDGAHNDTIQEVEYRDGECTTAWRAVRPLPDGGGFFENVWREFRKNGNVY